MPVNRYIAVPFGRRPWNDLLHKSPSVEHQCGDLTARTFGSIAGCLDAARGCRRGIVVVERYAHAPTCLSPAVPVPSSHSSISGSNQVVQPGLSFTGCGNWRSRARRQMLLSGNPVFSDTFPMRMVRREMTSSRLITVSYDDGDSILLHYGCSRLHEPGSYNGAHQVGSG